MTNWTPSIDDRPGPRYEAIVRALDEAVRQGELAGGDRLPPQRELARSLDVALGTVTRAYDAARERGLVEATVGRGTFVRPGAQGGPGELGARVEPGLVDLSFLTTPILDDEGWPALLEGAASDLAARPDLAELLSYQRHEGMPRHRRAGADRLERTGLEASADDVLVTAGAQHGVVAALSALTRPGDSVLCEELTTPGLHDAASRMHLRLHGLPGDEDGLLPDAFEAAARSGVARVLYTMPTYQNPTTRTMPAERRRRIAAIAAEHAVAVIEDGVHSLMAPDAPAPLAAHAPDHGYFVTSPSKTLSPSMRVGYLRAPSAAREELVAALRATHWMVSPLLAEAVTAWIDGGTADEVLEGKRAEARARRRLAGKALDGFRYEAGPTSLHLWLTLPEGWEATAFVEAARRRGVAVTSPRVFEAGQVTAPRAVRLCTGPARSREALEEGLDVMRRLLKEGPKATGVDDGRTADALPV